MTEICMGCKNAQKPKTGPTFGVQKGFEKSGAWEEIKLILCCGAIFWTPKSGSRFCAFFHTLCEILLVAQLRTKSLILIRANQDSIVHDSQLSIRAAPTHPRTVGVGVGRCWVLMQDASHDCFLMVGVRYWSCCIVAWLHDRNLHGMQKCPKAKNRTHFWGPKGLWKIGRVRRNQIDIVLRGHFLDPQKWVPFLCIFSHTVRNSTGGAAANEKFNIDQSQPRLHSSWLSTIHSRCAHASTNYAGPFMRPCFCLWFRIFKLGARKRTNCWAK